RLDAGVPSLSPAMERAFIRQANTDLSWVERALRRAETLSPLKTAAHPELVDTLGVANPEIPRPTGPVTFGPDAHWIPHARRAEVAGYDMAAVRRAYASGEVSPMGVLQILLEHPSARDGAIFPRPLDHGHYRRQLLGMAEESERRYREGNARPLEGVLIAVKDIFPGSDGRMHAGSKTARIEGVGSSPVVQSLMDLGAIPITVGMVASASGGTGMHAGFGYIPHPTRRDPQLGAFDPAGSSSATAHVVGHSELPIAVGIGTDTGGSVSAPAGAVGLFGVVPPAGLISTNNMVPFATFLDRVGVLARESRDAMEISRYLSKVEGSDPHQRLQNPGSAYQPSNQRPSIAYLESLVNQASPRAQVNFLRSLEEYRAQGYEIKPLGPEWDFISEAPMRLYPFDAYVAGAFTHTNPLQGQRFDPPRRVLDENLAVRLPKGAISLRAGFYDQARDLSRRYESLVNRKLGADVVLASPSTEAIPTADIVANRAGARLDGHDRITMAKNRIPTWGQMTMPARDHPEVGVAFSGTMPQLMHFSGEFLPLFRARTEPPPPQSLDFPQFWKPRVIQGEGGQQDLPSIPYAARVASPDESL
ncbi:MAG TPA: amidase, partial [bacterium]|nr:amidase [bacterium]